MKSIGFIGNEHDIQQRLSQLKQLYKNATVSILNSEIGAQKPNEFQTVEELVQHTDMVFFGHRATENLPLLYHTIKKAPRVFIDIQSLFSKSAFLKCKAYQEEAGSAVTFNINPYLTLLDLIPNSVEENNQVLIHHVSELSDIQSVMYNYLLFGYLYLNCSNTRSHFNIIEEISGKIKLINASLSNLKGRQVNIIVGNYKKELNHLQVFGQQEITELSIPNKKFFNDSEILKKQLNALYIDEPFAELNQGAAIAELINKMNERAKH